jgi:hypothetical protein
MYQYMESFAGVKQKFLSTSQNVAAAGVRHFIHFLHQSCDYEAGPNMQVITVREDRVGYAAAG